MRNIHKKLKFVFLSVDFDSNLSLPKRLKSNLIRFGSVGWMKERLQTKDKGQSRKRTTVSDKGRLFRRVK